MNSPQAMTKLEKSMLVKGKGEEGNERKREWERGAKGNSTDQATGHKMYEIVNNRFSIYGEM